MDEIIKKAIEGGYDYRGGEITLKTFCLDPLFWQALFRNKTEALIPRQKFFSILFGDEGGNEGWNEAVKYLEDLIN